MLELLSGRERLSYDQERLGLKLIGDASWNRYGNKRRDRGLGLVGSPARVRVLGFFDLGINLGI